MPFGFSRCDPTDDYLLRIAKKGRADVLVTGDKDLLVLERYGSARILSARQQDPRC